MGAVPGGGLRHGALPEEAHELAPEQLVRLGEEVADHEAVRRVLVHEPAQDLGEVLRRRRQRVLAVAPDRLAPVVVVARRQHEAGVRVLPEELLVLKVEARVDVEVAPELARLRNVLRRVPVAEALGAAAVAHLLQGLGEAVRAGPRQADAKDDLVRRQVREVDVRLLLRQDRLELQGQPAARRVLEREPGLRADNPKQTRTGGRRSDHPRGELRTKMIQNVLPGAAKTARS